MPEAGLFPLEAIAQVLNITPRHVQRLAKAGIIPPAKAGIRWLAASKAMCAILSNRLRAARQTP